VGVHHVAINLVGGCIDDDLFDNLAQYYASSLSALFFL
jgi:hypothetical protein